ncbi:hypothetical protein PsorP6_007518 [Peronosclerospora sorghi]|uniref:Uncharacterized protein n=1 Tax=Peronosclerospora sorghi TaxID=230839 RepID=A0ACC0W8Y2_9STRA|nr:hypothetical protein PsorP6_007518 [Peronosclerospora sorghi]
MRTQDRSALAMSVIQEERSSLENSTRTMSNVTPSSCASPTAATRSTSRSDSGLNPSRRFQTAPSRADAVKPKVPKSTRSRSVDRFENVESMAKGQAPNRELRAQSARARTPYSLNLNPSKTSAPAQKITRSNDMKLRSEQMRSIAWLNKATPCTTSAKSTPSSIRTTTEQLRLKAMKSSSARSRPVQCFDDSILSDRVKQPASILPAEKALKTTMSHRSRPAACFEDVLASDAGHKVTRSSPQQIKEGWRPRAVGTRPASSPTLNAPLKQFPPSSPTSVGDLAAAAKRTAQRRQSTPISAPRNGTLTRTKSSGNLSSKPAQQGCQPAVDDFQPLTRERASSDGDQASDDIPLLEDEQLLRPRSSSCLSSITAIDSSTDSSKKKKKSTSRIRCYEGKFQNRRGQLLFYFSLFPPEKTAMRGIILHLHGMGDHCRRSAPLYERFCSEGFGVITYDLLNHGASDYDKFNTRAHISNFDDFVDDTNDFITFAKSKIYKAALWYWRKHHHPHHPHRREKKRETPPELPLIISGASFGSLIGLQTVLSGGHKFHSAVWASPTIGVTWTPMLWAQWKMARPLVAAFPTAKVIPAIQHNMRSRDPEFLKKYQNDPLTSSDKMTPQSGQQSLSAMIRLQEDSRVSDSDSLFCAIPMLFLAGTEDYISDQQASYNFFTTLRSIDKEFKFFDGLYHMIYEEPEKEEVIQYVINWLHKRFPLETRHPNLSQVNVFKKLAPSIRSYNYVQAERTEL